MPIPFISNVSNSQDSFIRLITAPPELECPEEEYAANHLNDLGWQILYVICCICTIGLGALYKEGLSKRGLDNKISELKGIREAIQKTLKSNADYEIHEDTEEETLTIQCTWNGQKGVVFHITAYGEDGIEVKMPQLKQSFTTNKISYQALKQKFSDNHASPFVSSAPSTPVRKRQPTITIRVPDKIATTPYQSLPQTNEIPGYNYQDDDCQNMDFGGGYIIPT